MSNIKYGLISQTDARTLEATIDLICDGFPMDKGASHFHPSMDINVCEIGIYSGDTGRGICKYIKSKMRNPVITGIDNNKDGQQNTFFYNQLIIGNSAEVYNQIEDNSQHLIIVDGLHTFAGLVSDFFCYSPKVKVGGFIAFHDTGKHIDPLHGWQGVGFENDPDFCLGGVRKALEKIGLFQRTYAEGDYPHSWIGNKEFELIFDQADPNDEAGGFTVFQKLY